VANLDRVIELMTRKPHENPELTAVMSSVSKLLQDQTASQSSSYRAEIVRAVAQTVVEQISSTFSWLEGEMERSGREVKSVVMTLGKLSAEIEAVGKTLEAVEKKIDAVERDRATAVSADRVSVQKEMKSIRAAVKAAADGIKMPEPVNLLPIMAAVAEIPDYSEKLEELAEVVARPTEWVFDITRDEFTDKITTVVARSGDES
jgi:hypothetical protein